jgi:RNA-directed DNA polymerase
LPLHLAAQSLRLTGDAGTLATRFRAIEDLSDLARLLEITDRQLTAHSYGRGHHYRTFQVRKRRSGQFRDLAEPTTGLKIIQQKLNQLLLAIYEPPAAVHGFVPKRSVATNAHAHSGRQWVLNIDLEDFFPSIHFGRVRGVLVHEPYKLPKSVATVIAQLCCHDKKLPQGAPTSPTLSNMVMRRLDEKLSRLARRYRCTYTRYADDITFSSNRAAFPSALAIAGSDAEGRSVRLGNQLVEAVEGCDFKINFSKVRLQSAKSRQEVTGLTVNRKPNVQRRYVRRIRAMLNAWDVHGYEAAERSYFERYDTKDRGPHSAATFKSIVKGHLNFVAMVRGHDDLVYDKLLQRFSGLTGVPPRPLNRRPRNHLQNFADAIWIVEAWEGFAQGTGFELEGFGLVTCMHVLGNPETGEFATEVQVAQLRADSPPVKATVKMWDRDRDLAILECAAPSGVLLKPRFEPDPRTGQQVRAFGFPGHGPGHSMWQDEGIITGYWHHIGSPRYLCTIRVAGGASGGPVLNSAGAVIGVLSHGAETVEKAIQTVGTRFGMIPIRLLKEVRTVPEID